MYLYFSDFSAFLYKLDGKGIPHGERIIKVCTLETDPRTLLERPSLPEVQSPGHLFRSDENFTYPGRGTYYGLILDIHLKKLGLSDYGLEAVHSLFRFANLPETGFCEYAMSAKNPDGSFFIDHPLKDLDGIDKAVERPEARSRSIHIDLFSERSLGRIRQFVNIDDPSQMVNWRETHKITSLPLDTEGKSIRNRIERAS